jgi:hypothetical protein
MRREQERCEARATARAAANARAEASKSIEHHTMLDLVVHFVNVLSVEGGDAHRQLIEQDTQAPPVHRLMTELSEHGRQRQSESARE